MRNNRTIVWLQSADDMPTLWDDGDWGSLTSNTHALKVEFAADLKWLADNQVMCNQDFKEYPRGIRLSFVRSKDAVLFKLFRD